MDQVATVSEFLLHKAWLRPFLVAGLSALMLTWLLVWVAPRRRWVVTPRQDRWNRRVVAQFGGVPILLSLSIAVIFLRPGWQIGELLCLIVGMGLLGFVDDIVGLGPNPKLLVEVLLAGIAVRIGMVGVFTSSPLLNWCLSVLWIVGITNAFNLIDNMDGLAGGIAVIGLAQTGLFLGSSTLLGTVALCLLAAIAGFLVFNVHPARIFMGDVGSLPIGFFLGCTSIMSVAHLRAWKSMVGCGLILFVPIFDVLLVSVTRRMNGRPISQGARDHTSHRLVYLGLSEKWTTAVLYALAMLAGIVGFGWGKRWPEWSSGLVGLFFVGALGFWSYLANLNLPESWLSHPRAGSLPAPAYLRRFLSKSPAVLLDVAVIMLAVYFSETHSADHTSGQFWYLAVWSVVINLTCLALCGVYRLGWRLSGIGIRRSLTAVSLGSALTMAISFFAPRSAAVPVMVIFSDVTLIFMLLLMNRSAFGLFDSLFAISRKAIREEAGFVKEYGTRDRI